MKIDRQIRQFLEGRFVLLILIILSLYTLVSRLRITLSRGHLFLEDAYNIGNAAYNISKSGYWDPTILTYVPGLPFLISILNLITGISVLEVCRFIVAIIAGITAFPAFALSRRIIKRDKESLLATYFFIITYGYFRYTRIMIPAPIGFLLIFLCFFVILQTKIPIKKSLGIVSVLGGALFIIHQLSFYALFLVLITISLLDYIFHGVTRNAKISFLASLAIFVGAAPFWLPFLFSLGPGVFGGTGVGWGNVWSIYIYLKTPKQLYQAFIRIIFSYYVSIWWIRPSGISYPFVLFVILGFCSLFGFGCLSLCYYLVKDREKVAFLTYWLVPLLLCFIPHIINVYGIWPNFVQYLQGTTGISEIRLMLYIPSFFPEPFRVMEYYWLPIGILSAKFYSKLLRVSRIKLGGYLSMPLFFILLISITLPSEIFIWTYQPPPTYLRITDADITGMKWIKLNTPTDVKIIAHPEGVRSDYYRAQWILEIHTEREAILLPEVFSSLNIETIQKSYRGHYIYLNQWALSEFPSCKPKFDNASDVFMLVFSAQTTYIYKIN